MSLICFHTHKYKRKVRSFVFVLKHRDSIQGKVVGREISVKKLVSSSVEQLTQKFTTRSFIALDKQ